MIFLHFFWCVVSAAYGSHNCMLLVSHKGQRNPTVLRKYNVSASPQSSSWSELADEFCWPPTLAVFYIDAQIIIHCITVSDSPSSIADVTRFWWSLERRMIISGIFQEKMQAESSRSSRIPHPLFGSLWCEENKMFSCVTLKTGFRVQRVMNSVTHSYIAPSTGFDSVTPDLCKWWLEDMC